ncbi:MAG: M20/M25/M40 family metallo-hydrolase [Gemmatimonadota bacterium]|nr:M20/M25/M40 family metallo-hydrolase [Gemmatimonadota bacterium]
MTRKEPSFENALTFAADLIRTPGLSGDEGRVAERVENEMRALGLERVRIDDVGNVIGVVPGSGAGPPILLASHLDVVAEGDHAEWEVPPFSGTVEGGYLHGRGAMDIKGPLAVQTYAAASMIGRAAGDVVVAHTVLEEQGGLGMKALLESETVDPAWVVIGEATHGDICIGHRGRAEVEVHIRGKAGHASEPSRARNALDLLGDVLAAIRALDEDQPADPVLGSSTAVATTVDVAPETRNVIPDRVLVAVDWRILPGDSSESLIERLGAAIRRRMPEVPDGWSVDVRIASVHQRTYTGFERAREMYSPGFLMDPEDPAVQAAAAAVGRRDGSDVPARVRPWRFATDGGWTRGVHGIPTIGFAPGEEHFAHTNRERISVDEFRWALERYPRLVEALQGAGSP